MGQESECFKDGPIQLSPSKAESGSIKRWKRRAREGFRASDLHEASEVSMGITSLQKRKVQKEGTGVMGESKEKRRVWG